VFGATLPALLGRVIHKDGFPDAQTASDKKGSVSLLFDCMSVPFSVGQS
jgi:hypothetical protein